MKTSPRLIEPVFMIVLTGGPCSGKSSSLAYLTEKLSDHGFMVFVVPETATLITNSGIDRRKMDKSHQVIVYEEAIFDMQLAFEEIYKNTVIRVFPEKKKIILLDRGIMDIRAFMPEKDFKNILKKKRISEIELRARYTGVIHLVTAAAGAIEFYTGENNPARIETPEEAVRIDMEIREGWLGHPYLKIIDNTTNFENKIARAFSAISSIIGMPVPLPIAKRYLIRDIDHKGLPVHQTIHIEKQYIRSKEKNEQINIKKRGQDGTSLYFLSRKTLVKEEELITEQEYNNLAKLLDPKTNKIVKERICFFWNNQYFEIDRYAGHNQGITILKVEPVETSGGKVEIDIPPFINVYEDITDKKEYNERNMALKQKKIKPF